LVCQVWSVESACLLHDPQGHEAPVTSVCCWLDRMGQVVTALTGDAAGGMRAWEAAAGRLLWSVQAHEGGVNIIAMHDSDAGPWQAVSAAEDGFVKLWNGETGELVRDVGEPHGAPVRAMELHNAGLDTGHWYAVASSAPGDVRVHYVGQGVTTSSDFSLFD
jgi:WD40 repeat protein